MKAHSRHFILLFFILICRAAWPQIDPKPHYVEPAEEALRKAREEAVQSEDWGSTPPVKLDIPGINEVWRFNEQIFAGDGPPAEESYYALGKAGINTIISIDIAMPDYILATAHDMSYAHIPIRIGRLSAADYMRLLRVIAYEEGHYYIHGAPGEDRAYALAAMSTHVSEFRTAWRIYYLMDESDFSPGDVGLRYSALTPLALQLIDRARSLPTDIPPFMQPPPMIWWMQQFEESFTLLRDSSQTGWQTPPDAVGTTSEYEARTIAEMAERWLSSHPRDQGDMRKRMEKLRETAESLNTALRAGDVTAISGAWTEMSSACMECHQVYRDSID